MPKSGVGHLRAANTQSLKTGETPKLPEARIPDTRVVKVKLLNRGQPTEVSEPGVRDVGKAQR